MKKITLQVWDSENYTQETAKKFNRLVEFETVLQDNQDANKASIEFLVERIVGMCSEVLRSNEKAVRYSLDVQEVREYTVSSEVLEWNTYTATVLATSKEDAVKVVERDGIIGKQDLELETWASSNVDDSRILITERNARAL